MSRFWSETVHRLTPYVPGEQPKLDNLIKLNTNECPYGPSPQVINAIKAELSDRLRLYPDPNAERLTAAIARYFSLPQDNVFVGNGSDEVLAHVFHGLLNHNAPVLFPDISYSFYPVYCNLYNIASRPIPLTSTFTIDVDDYRTTNGGIVIANPNAPTGVLLSVGDIRRLLDGNPNSVVVVDEAYIDFGGESVASLIPEYENLLVVQTLSKSRSLAGLRVGFALGQKDLIAGLERVKNSFNSYPLARLSISGAVAAMEDNAYFEEVCGKVIASRDRLSRDLQGLGFEVLPSAANFVLVSHSQQSASALAAQLRQRRILVRHFNSPRIDNFLRISIGTDKECRALVQALEEILSSAG
jgi:histidinol-phosphate aminotransferase